MTPIEGAPAGPESSAALEARADHLRHPRTDAVGGIACPLGAHYLPVPDPKATLVRELCQDLGLLQDGHWDELHLCHSPQERLYLHGRWQEGLLPEPLGVGRGRHYSPAHLKRLLEVKTLQEQGRSLAEIREAVGGDPSAKGRPVVLASPPPRAQFVRLEILPGVELNVSSSYRVPSPGRLAELSEWCRTHLRRLDEEER